MNTILKPLFFILLISCSFSPTESFQLKDEKSQTFKTSELLSWEGSSLDTTVSGASILSTVDGYFIMDDKADTLLAEFSEYYEIKKDRIRFLDYLYKSNNKDTLKTIMFPKEYVGWATTNTVFINSTSCFYKA